MKKPLKIIGFSIGALALIIGAVLLYINSTDIASYPTANFEYKVEMDTVLLQRGEKLATLLCANCHLNRETGKLTGIRMLDAPPEFGKIYSQNITQDKNVGIGNYTDAELLYLLRTGIKKNGQYSPPYMAKLPLMADEDINAIILFLRSNNSMVTADATPDVPCEPSLLTKILAKVAWKPFEMPTTPIIKPDTTNTIKFGEYLAINLECFSCHSADFKTNNFLNPSASEGYFGGGNKTLDAQGRLKLTLNLTPDKETGIGNWSEETFVNALKYGIKEGENALEYPMLPYTQLSDYEAKAIFSYLKTIPPIKNKVARNSYN